MEVKAKNKIRVTRKVKNKNGEAVQQNTELFTDSYITVKGARVNNLKNIDIQIPHNKFVVVTGLSGSGKTSLVFDTIYAEGQRRYIESLSSYARQFLERINKPDVDSITGLAPSMAIEVKTASRNPRSTVGTTTEIYDYLRLLFARAGKTYSPVSGKEVSKDSVEEIFKFINRLKDKTRFYILFPVHTHESKTVKQEIENLKQKGYFRVYNGKEIIDLNQSESIKNLKPEDLKVVVDRLVYNKEGDDEQRQRIADSLEQAYTEGEGYLMVLTEEEAKQNTEKGSRFRGNDSEFAEHKFNLHLEADGIRFEEPEPILFSFNNPVGACPKCQGFGETIDLDPDLIIPYKNKSLFKP